VEQLDARRSGCTNDQFIQELFRETPKSSDGLFHGL